MHHFSYSRAGNVAEAILEKAATPGAMFIAGGTNLLDLMKIDMLTPGHLMGPRPGIEDFSAFIPRSSELRGPRWSPPAAS